MCFNSYNLKRIYSIYWKVIFLECFVCYISIFLARLLMKSQNWLRNIEPQTKKLSFILWQTAISENPSFDSSKCGRNNTDLSISKYLCVLIRFPFRFRLEHNWNNWSSLKLLIKNEAVRPLKVDGTEVCSSGHLLHQLVFFSYWVEKLKNIYIALDSILL